MVRRVLTLTDGFNYHTYLPLIIDRYNKSPHSSLKGLSPHEIYRENKKKDKLKSIFLRKVLSPVIYTKEVLKEGTLVRIARSKSNVFEKSSLRRWTNEKFKIKKVFLTDPVTYQLEDLNNEKITGIFYREELQKI